MVGLHAGLLYPMTHLTQERTRWELALLAAELNASIYAAYLQQHGLPSVPMQAGMDQRPHGMLGREVAVLAHPLLG